MRDTLRPGSLGNALASGLVGQGGRRPGHAGLAAAVVELKDAHRVAGVAGRVQDPDLPAQEPEPVVADLGTSRPVLSSVVIERSSDRLDQAAVQAHEAALHALLVDGLKQRQGIQLLGSPHLALVSFVVEGGHNADLAHVLTEQGIAVRAGHHCAMPLLKSFGLAGAIRVSLALYNDSEDLERFFDALDQALELLQ